MKKRNRIFGFLMFSIIFTAAWFQTICDWNDEITKEYVTVTTVNDDGTEEVHEYIVEDGHYISIDE